MHIKSPAEHASGSHRLPLTYTASITAQPHQHHAQANNLLPAPHLLCLPTIMEQLRCIAIVANLEGIRCIELPGAAAEASSLSRLDQRVRVLETTLAITPPPPVSEPSWGSLVWRLWRVSSKTLGMGSVSRGERHRQQAADASLLSSEDQSRITLDAIKETVDVCTRVYRYPAWPKCATDEEMFIVLLQRLAHVMGKRHEVWDEVPTTLLDLYTAAAALSFDCEATPYRGGPQPGWSNIPGVRSKTCCNCCSCHCHSASGVRAPPRGITVFPVQKKKKSQWFKKLFFWRRKNKHGFRDDSSSSSFSTLAD